MQGRDIRNGSKSDQNTTEMIHMYENQRREMDVELQQLRRDVRRLNLDLKDSKNNSPARPSKDNDEGRSGRLAKRLESETRDVEDRATLLQRREEQVVRDITRMKNEVSKTNQILEQLEEVNTNLTMELESRPTIRDWKKSQRMIALLQNKLRDEMNGDGTTSQNNQRERLGLQSIEGQDTSQMVRKDRENHRLKLHLLDGQSRGQSIELLKTICRTLGIGGDGLLFKIQPTIERIQQVVLAVPRMQTFVREICFTLQVDPATTLGVAMEMGLTKIKSWETSITRKKEMERLVQALVMELVTNRANRLITPGGTTLQDFDDVRLLAEIKNMIALEKKPEKENNFYESIEQEMRKNPTGMTTRMINHFKQLFDVTSIQGVTPKMNELFLYSSEMKTFLDAVKGKLKMNPHATTSAVMQALTEVTKTESVDDALNKASDPGDDSKNLGNLKEERRTSGGTSFSVSTKGVPGWTVEK